MTDGTAPGPGAPSVGPGVEPRWTSSAKSGVGTALDGRSHVWFTISHGIIDEVYYPRVDQANTRDLGLLVSGPDGFFSEEKRDTRSDVHLVAPGVPGYRIVNRCVHDRYEIEKTVITDPERDVLMQRVRFRALQGSVEDYRIFALLAPHICNQGFGNDGWAERYKGVPMLFARRLDVALALSCDAGWRAMSCGYVGVNDGWRQVKEHGFLADPCNEVRAGNIALTGEVDLANAPRPHSDVAEFVVVLGFGLGPAEAAQRSRMSLASSFEFVKNSYTRAWTHFHEHTVGPRSVGSDATMPEQSRQTAARDLASLAHGSTHAHEQKPKRPKGERRRQTPITLPDSVIDLYRMSAAILAIHEDKRASGAIIASLSIPWGNTKSDHELGGYHLVWPRDLVNSAGALIALGHNVLARRTLRYLMSTQEEDGRWAQNLWLDGTPYWNGVQMDEIAFPILFAEMLRREGKLEDLNPYPMIRRAAGFLLRHGPSTGQDRWEENGGYSTFTLAVEVSAMLVAADFAERAGEKELGTMLRNTADAWNARIEEWTYVRDTPIARAVGVEGYYVRVAPADVADAAPASRGVIPIKNRIGDDGWARYDEIVSPDALALVRFGLRDPNDPRIVNTVRVIDAMLRAHTATGPAWYRYNRDGYGEHEDGSPFDGCGVGRPWPLLAGERAHYELAAGRPDVAMQLLGVMRAQASDGGMLPEQVWDGPDHPEFELVNGRATGGAMPLVWAHAEYAKLVRSLHDGRVFDMPQQPYERYVRERVGCDITMWSPLCRARLMHVGNRLHVYSPTPAHVRWSVNGTDALHTECTDTTVGMWIAELDTERLPVGAKLQFAIIPQGEASGSDVHDVEVIA
ncbi:MAG: glycoside hydrolase family 15 protein [Gemmatimonadota bacterium]|nr:glycoside hydrolase family 15 protein [Gemmatimonadota bacterium]